MSENRPCDNVDPCIQVFQTILNDIETSLSTLEQETTELIQKMCIGELTRCFLKLNDCPIEIFRKLSLQFNNEHFERIRQRCQTQYERLPNATWADITRELHRLETILSIDFSKKPISFAQAAVQILDELYHCEGVVLKTIEKLQNVTEVQRLFYGRYKSMKERRNKIVIGCIGTLKAGKSSFVNYLLDDKICPVGIERLTGRLCKITYGKKNLIRVLFKDGRRKEYIIEDDGDASVERCLRPLVELNGADRSSDACEDRIIIELNREELRKIELWDIPGFDENPQLDQMIGDVLSDADLLFILTPLIDSARTSAMDLVKKALECRRSTTTNEESTILSDNICFIATKVDFIRNVSTSGTVECLETHLDTLREHISAKVFQQQRVETFRLIPISTNPANDIKIFAKCRQKFFEESSEFFARAIQNAVNFRLENTISIVNEILDYYNVDRAIKNYKAMEVQLLEDLRKIGRFLFEDLQPMCMKIECDVLMEIQSLYDKIPWYRDGKFEEELIKRLDSLCRKAIRALSDQIKKQMDISCRKILASFYFNAELSARIQQSFIETVVMQPYSVPIGQLSSITWESLDESKNGLEFLLEWVRFYMSEIFSDKQMYIERVEEALHRDVTETIQKICRKRQDQMLHFIQNQLGQIIANIGNKQITLKDMTESHQNSETLRNFQTKNVVDCVRRTCLTVYETQFRLKYSIEKIKRKRINSVNLSIFEGSLVSKNSNDKIRTMIERVPRNLLNIDQLQYIRSIKHENIIKIYGMLNCEEEEGNVYIFMHAWNYDLKGYLFQYSEQRKVNETVLDHIITQIVRGLDHIHSLDFVHHYFQLGNIFLNISNDETLPTVQIANLGLYRGFSSLYNSTTMSVALESNQQQNQSELKSIDFLSDIYSLGVVIETILRTPCHQRDGRLVQFWNRISDQCQNASSTERPLCHWILDKRTKLPGNSNNLN